MGQLSMIKSGRWIIALALLAALTMAVGCSKATPTASSGSATDYTGALSTSYDGALDVTSQLALGTLELEGTTNAVTEEQAVKLLPLWEALQGSAAQTTAEQSAVIRQIEAAMTQPQVAAIAGMQLTQQALQAWAQDRGLSMPAPGGPVSGTPQPGGQGQSTEAMATRRAQVTQMSPQERETRAAQFGGQTGQQGGRQSTTPRAFATRSASSSGAGAGRSSGLMSALVVLLRQRGGQQTAQATLSVTPRATIVFMSLTPTVTATVATAITPTSTQTATPGSTPTPVPTATPSPSPMVEATIPAPTNTPVATRTSSPASTPRATSTPKATPIPALTQLEDKDPGPPFTIEISANRASPDPLDAQNVTYKVTGLVRNNGTETYSVSAIHITFFDASGFRGSFYRFPQSWQTGGEWIWHGKTQADFACLLLAPGEECPFNVQITARNMASFLIHADATATGRQSVPVALSNLRAVRDGTSFVRVTGTATNRNSFNVKSVTVSGALLDASGQIVSVGSTYVVQTGIVPGGSVPVDLRIPAESYASYRLYAQAERE